MATSQVWPPHSGGEVIDVGTVPVSCSKRCVAAREPNNTPSEYVHVLVKSL